MRFKDVFSIIGPAMIGPSSSHTAGAVRLGQVARALLGEAPERAEITFYGSFADTYRGHGTDLAAVAGLLGWATDDPRLPQSLESAASGGLAVTFRTASQAVAHPNTADFQLVGGGRTAQLRGASIGGGNVRIDAVNGFEVTFSGDYPTLLIFHADREGAIAELTGSLSEAGVNIGWMELDRKGRRGEALTVIEADGPLPAALPDRLRTIRDVRQVTVIERAEGTS